VDTAHSPFKIDTRQQIELAEGVEVSLRVAGAFPRVFAFVADLLIRAALSVGLLILMGLIFGMLGSWEVGSGMSLLITFFVTWLYMIIFEAGKHGATPGKRMMGLRVVQPSGAPITVGQAVTRNLLRFADGMPFIMIGEFSFPFGTYGLGLIFMLFTQRFQRLGDLSANTLVVYDKPFTIQGMALEYQKDTDESLMPQVVLGREDEAAIVSFAERAPFWSDERRAELADYLTDVTGASGAKGAVKLKAIGQWLQSER